MSTFKTALLNHIEAINNRDLQKFAEYLDPSRETVLILPNGHKIEGYNDILNFHNEWFSDKDWKMECHIINLLPDEKFSYSLLDVIYYDVDEDGKQYSLSYYLSLLFEKVDDRWILIRDQNTLK